MAFTTPCFVRVEDREERKKLIEWLKEIGHNVCDCCLFDGLNTINCNTLLHDSTVDVHGVPDNDIESEYNVEIFKHENSLEDRPSYDCGTNVDLFRALAAMNDENDREQWFVVKKNISDYYDIDDIIYQKGDMFFNESGEPLVEKHFRKATAEEIVEHFKKK